jgi:hypothetical protein
LNSNDDIKKYFDGLDRKDRTQKKTGSFVPADVIKGKSVASSGRATAAAGPAKKSKQETKTVLPKDLHIRFGNDRLIDIRRELVKLKREQFPNAGAILLRAFFELTVVNYLERTGEMEKLIAKLGGKGKLPFGVPTLKQMMPVITQIAKKQLSATDANKVEKAIRYDAAAPFTLSDLHSFVHQAADLPSARDIWQFWLRTEPLFRLMLEREPELKSK